MKKGDRVLLECGHQGRVAWISEDGAQMAVKGTRRRCSKCYKNRTNVTVYIMDT
jgi:hypothetical protein